MNDLEISEFKMELVNKINTAELPISVKRMIVSELLQELIQVEQKVIAEQMAEREAKEDGTSEG